MKCTVIYRTLSLKTKNIDIAKKEEITVVLEILQGKILFYTRGRKFGAVEVRFSSENLATKRTRKTIKTKGWGLLPTYLGHKVARSIESGRATKRDEVECDGRR